MVAPIGLRKLRRAILEPLNDDSPRRQSVGLQGKVTMHKQLGKMFSGACLLWLW